MCSSDLAMPVETSGTVVPGSTATDDTASDRTATDDMAPGSAEGTDPRDVASDGAVPGGADRRGYRVADAGNGAENDAVGQAVEASST